MAEKIPVEDKSAKRPDLQIETPRALADIGYNSLAAADHATSSEDEATDTQITPDEEARTAIGVSISHAQTRLTSPTTPAVEKAAAIEAAGGFFGGSAGANDVLVEEPEEDEDEDEQQDRKEDKKHGRRVEAGAEQPPSPKVPERSPRRTEVRLPSPWRSHGTANWQKTGKEKSGLFDGIFNRRRASSGPESALQGWQRSLLSSLPSIPKQLSRPSPFSSSLHTKDGSTSSSTLVAQRSDTQSQSSRQDHDGVTFSGNRKRAESDGIVKQFNHNDRFPRSQVPDDADIALPKRPSLQTTRSRTGRLTRSTSDQSLTTMRTLSVAESLGDDSRFEHVQDQVNSRLKAIKDSWQDSNIRLPAMSNFSVSSFAPDFWRERSGSTVRRQEIESVGGVGQTAAGVVDPMTRQPYHSAKAAISDSAAGKPSAHPHFNDALEQIEGDVVILGGYRGSILRSAEFPHRQLWVPVKVGLNLRKVNLEVGLEEDYDERATEDIIPGGMLTHIGPVDIARRLFKRLRASENARAGKLRVHDYGYDWRLHPHFLSRKLVAFLESLPCNKPGVPLEKRGATVIAHSLGGLITRHAVNQRPDLFRGIVYAGVPNTCVNILGPMRNGDEVLLSSRVLTAQVNFTVRTSFALLPLDGRCFFDKATKEEYPVDFFNPQTWIENRFSPCVGRPLPPLNGQVKASGISGYVSSVANALPSLPLPGRKGSLIALKNPFDASKATSASVAAEPDSLGTKTGDSNRTIANGNIDTTDSADISSSVSTAVTIPRHKAIEYLTRTLASVKKFKQELVFNPSLGASNAYPPVAVIYGKSTPTVYGAKVNGREGIKHADAYDELAFASGDGVVLARAAMVPEGYTTARGGVVSSDRGHVTLLGDLEAVGKCLNAVIGARKKRVGMGKGGS